MRVGDVWKPAEIRVNLSRGVSKSQEYLCDIPVLKALSAWSTVHYLSDDGFRGHCLLHARSD